MFSFSHGQIFTRAFSSHPLILSFKRSNDRGKYEKIEGCEQSKGFSPFDVENVCKCTVSCFKEKKKFSYGERRLCSCYDLFPHVFDDVGSSCMDYATAQIARLQYSKVPSKG